MDVKDFRIGNLVQDIQYKSPMRITQFYGTTMFELDSPYMEYTDYRCDADLDNYEPIPLTADWLIKFGFKNYTLKKFRLIIGHWHKGKCGLYWRKGKGFCKSGKGIKVKYVHQLQNLYYALTGNELTTN